jgi:hypothetical protein
MSFGERAGLSTGAGEGEGEGEGESTETNTANNPQSTWQAQLTLVLTALAADNTRQTNS